nr:immunoglobulin heavy chain junction region [Mus musculus]
CARHEDGLPPMDYW